LIRLHPGILTLGAILKIVSKIVDGRASNVLQFNGQSNSVLEVSMKSILVSLALSALTVALTVSVALASPAKVINDGFGCQTKNIFKDLIKLDGKPALKAKLTPLLKSGECINLKKGTAVETTGENFMFDLVRVQIGGKGKDYWTSIKFVE
jgi:hypothetical protein